MGPVTPTRHTRMLAADQAGIAAAAEILRAGGLVAFPTETVYGLGAAALDRVAVAGIFEAKGRPANDPLIVHVVDFSRSGEIAMTTAVARRLAEAFMPGPLTLVLRRLPIVPDVVTAGLDTVAIRVPAHPVARALLGAARLPIAAPSANLFGRPSPTRASHVVLGMALLPPPIEPAPLAPGMLPAHYAPRTDLVLVTGPPARARGRLATELREALADGQRVGVLLLDEDRDLIPPGVTQQEVGSYAAPDAVAARLFDALRALDRVGLDMLFTRQLANPSSGIGRALADRLRRAAQRTIDA